MSVLDTVLPQYEPISRAIKFEALRAQAGEDDDRLDRLIKNERVKLYKSMDASGIVYLIQNPAVWEWDAKKKGLIRPAPLKQGPIGQLKGSQPAPQGNSWNTWGYR